MQRCVEGSVSCSLCVIVSWDTKILLERPEFYNDWSVVLKGTFDVVNLVFAMVNRST